MATARVADLVTTMRADTAKFDRDIESTKKRLRGYTADAKSSVKQNNSLGRSFVSVAGSASQLPGPLGKTAANLDSLGVSIGVLSSGWGAMGAAASVAIGAIAAGLPVLAETERRLLQQEQLLRATGFASGFTAEQLDEMARSVAMATLTSTEQASKAIGAMLTFKSVSGSTFKQAIHLSQDLASVMGGDITSAAKQLGKALEMPSIGVSSLRESGISFTASQMDMIKAMEEAGDVAGAQQVVLKALESQIGGAASAEAGGLIGAVDTLGQAVEESFEAFTKWSGVKPIITDIINEMSEGALAIRDFFDPTVTDKALDLMSERAKIIKEMNAAGSYESLPSINPFGYSKNEYKNDQRRLYEINNELTELRAERNKRIQAENEAAQKAADAAAEREIERKKEQEAKKEAIAQAAEEKKLEREARDQEREKAREAREMELAARRAERAQAETDQWLSELDRRNMTEMELMTVKESDEMFRLQSLYEQKLMSYEDFEKAKTEISKYYNDERLRQQQEANNQELDMGKMLFGQQYKDVDSFLTTLGNLKNSKNKKMAKIAKNAAIFQTIINTSSAAMKSYNALADIPYIGPGLATTAFAATIALGAGQIAMINNANYAGAYDNGGYIPAGKWGVTGEYGPELTLGPSHIVGRKKTMDMLNESTRSQANPGNLPPIVNIAEAPVGTHVRSSYFDEKQQRQIINIVCQDVKLGGDTAGLMEMQYALKRQGR
ncbi:phage tail length tape measure family protein [Vibrio harveyi]|uniref:phage tail length tape measure family protein n=1 Tax=Vibrio harveyi TaxID=669 RepID=UPI003BB50789